MLYFTNSMGAAAAVGVLVSAFVLLALVGLPGTILTACLINIFVAMVAWGLSKLEPVEVRTEATTVTTGGDEKLKFSRYLLGVALLTGLASFFYEIAWIRMLSLVLGSSMQAFELICPRLLPALPSADCGFIGA